MLKHLTIALMSFTIVNYAAAEATVGSSSVNIEQTISVWEQTAMDFAVILPDMSGDTIRLREGSITSTSGNSIFSGTAFKGDIRANGVPNSVVEVAVSEASIQITGPGQAMTVNNFTRLDTTGTTLTLDGSGLGQALFGADLIINANQLPGGYTGTYNVSVNYQ